MKISYNWLKEYIDLDLPAEQVAELLTNTGLEVEEVETFESIPGGLKGLIVGHVESVVKHPNADKLSLCQVDVGAEEKLSIVCGAPNVAAGQKVVVAPVGVTLHPVSGEPFKIKKSKIRGELSQGMICAEDEIGLGPEHDGILVLEENAGLGSAVRDYYDIQTDHIFVIGLTPNRSDAMSHTGTARDLAAAVQMHLQRDLDIRWPEANLPASDNSMPIPVEVQNPELCARYSGLTLRNVQVADSPAWMQTKLRSIGLRPINNIVDITNFVLHELGQPLHAFDADKIEGGKVVVRCLPEGTAFTTLDEVERKLSDEDLMICDGNGGMCIAGVFGGADSGVTAQTQNIFLESAYFDPVSVRRSAGRHYLHTDASSHFEKGMDPNNTVNALKRAAALICEIAGGQVASEIIDVYPKKIEAHSVRLRWNNLNRLAGLEIEQAIAKNIILKLGMTIADEDDAGITVSVPTFKPEVTREADMIEEVLRIYGFNNIPSPPALRSSVPSVENKPDHRLQRTLSEMLAGMGFTEMMTNSISKSSYYANNDNGSDHAVYMANSMTAELDQLRASMLYGCLEVVQFNINHKNPDLKFFEFGRTYRREQQKYASSEHLIVLMTGKDKPENWITASEAQTYHHLTGSIEALLLRLSSRELGGETSEHPNLAFAQQLFAGEKAIGTAGLVAPAVARRFDIELAVWYADLDWKALRKIARSEKVKAKPISRFPSIRRDVALLVDEGIRFEQIRSLGMGASRKILRKIDLFDVYRGKNIDEGKKSYALSHVFQDPDKTLTDKEVDKVMRSIVERYQSELKAEIR